MGRKERKHIGWETSYKVGKMIDKDHIFVTFILEMFKNGQTVGRRWNSLDK